MMNKALCFFGDALCAVWGRTLSLCLVLKWKRGDVFSGAGDRLGACACARGGGACVGDERSWMWLNFCLLEA